MRGPVCVQFVCNCVVQVVSVMQEGLEKAAELKAQAASSALEDGELRFEPPLRAASSEGSPRA